MYPRLAALVIATTLSLPATTVHAASKDEAALAAGCDWLARAIDREPERDDALGMFMRGMRPKCQAMLEGIARKDNSVQPKTMRQIANEIGELQAVIDAEHGGPPPARQGPTPAELAEKRVADEKAAEERAAQDKAEAERAAAERAAEEKAAAERAAQEEAAAERAAAERAAAEAARAKAEAERAAREEAERAAADRDAKQQEEADKRAAAEAKAAAERARAEAEAKKRAEEEARAAAEREQARLARERAAAEKAAEEARRAAEREAAARQAAEEEARRQAQALLEAEEERERIEAMRQAGADAKPKPKRLSDKGIDGTWEQPAKRVLDRNVKRTLNLMTKGKEVDGELYEEVWFDAPTAWIDTSCGGNKTFRMVTTARVSGEIDGNSVELSREAPRILTCTCSSRCTTEKRRRGFDLSIAASGRELKDSTGVFVRPGAVVVAATTDGHAPGQEVQPVDFSGNWETAPFSSRDRKIVQRLEIQVDAKGMASGNYIERVSQDLPLSSWSDRFCGGADKWEWVTQWTLEGEVSGRKGAMRATDGSHILCSCPSKCRKPKSKIRFDLVYGVTGATLHIGDRSFERR